MGYKILVCRTGQAPEVREVGDPWKFAQALLGPGSYIEVVQMDDGVQAFVDEEGRLKNLPLNRIIATKGLPVPDRPPDFVIKTAPDLADPGEPGEWRLYGDFILTRHNLEKDVPLSLTEQDIKNYTELAKGGESHDPVP